MTTSLHNLLEKHAEIVAPAVLGWKLTRYINSQKIVVRIVETEAYHQSDTASHSFNGVTQRTQVMFGEPGRLYVYFTYGMHYCCNIVTGKVGEGSAVLIRAVEPVEGVELLQKNRPNVHEFQLTNGPAKLCQALEINNELNGHNLLTRPLILEQEGLKKGETVVTSERIGISREKDKPWRFFIKHNAYVSRRPT